MAPSRTLFSAVAVSCAAALVTASAAVAVTPDGTLDPSYNTNVLAGPIPADSINAIALLPNEQAYVGGGAGELMRVNVDGTIDPNFTAECTLDESITAIVVQSDGKIVVATDSGATCSGSGPSVSVNGILRFNPDGTVDTSTQFGFAANGTVTVMRTLANGNIMIGGGFSAFDTQPTSHYAVLDASTLAVTSFLYTGSIDDARAIEPLSDGTVYLGGATNGLATVERLLLSGQLDSSFTPATGIDSTNSGYIGAIAVRPSGQIVIAGQFTQWGSVVTSGIIGLTAAGAIDSSFATGVGVLTDSSFARYVNALALQYDGSMLVLGAFAGYQTTQSQAIFRVLPTGAIDPSFASSGGFAVFDQARAITVLSSGGIIIGGILSSYGGTNVGNLVRLDNAPNIAPTPSPTGTSTVSPTSTSALAATGSSFTPLGAAAATLLALGAFAVLRRARPKGQ